MQPSNATAGSAISPSLVVDVEDSNGNIVTTDDSSVTLAVNTGPGTLTGTVTVNAVNGVATFSDVKIDEAGTYTLTASDDSLDKATSSSFTVSAGAAAQLAFSQQPTGVSAGASITPAVTIDVEDQFGNVVTTDSSDVTLSLASGSGTLSGTTTVAAVDGVATFSNLSVNHPGAYTLEGATGRSPARLPTALPLRPRPRLS